MCLTFLQSKSTNLLNRKNVFAQSRDRKHRIWPSSRQQEDFNLGKKLLQLPRNSVHESAIGETSVQRCSATWKWTEPFGNFVNRSKIHNLRNLNFILRCNEGTTSVLCDWLHDFPADRKRRRRCYQHLYALREAQSVVASSFQYSWWWLSSES